MASKGHNRSRTVLSPLAVHTGVMRLLRLHRKIDLFIKLKLLDAQDSCSVPSAIGTLGSVLRKVDSCIQVSQASVLGCPQAPVTQNW